MKSANVKEMVRTSELCVSQAFPSRGNHVSIVKITATITRPIRTPKLVGYDFIFSAILPITRLALQRSLCCCHSCAHLGAAHRTHGERRAITPLQSAECAHPLVALDFL